MSQTQVKPDRDQAPSTPRWVIVFGIIALALVLLFVILHLTGNGFDHMSMPPVGRNVQQP